MGLKFRVSHRTTDHQSHHLTLGASLTQLHSSRNQRPENTKHGNWHVHSGMPRRQLMTNSDAIPHRISRSSFHPRVLHELIYGVSVDFLKHFMNMVSQRTLTRTICMRSVGKQISHSAMHRSLGARTTSLMRQQRSRTHQLEIA